jgi:hypothetical protein
MKTNHYSVLPTESYKIGATANLVTVRFGLIACRIDAVDLEHRTVTITAKNPKGYVRGEQVTTSMNCVIPRS